MGVRSGQWGVPTIALAAMLLAIVGLTHLLLRWWVRRQSRRYEASARWVCVDEGLLRSSFCQVVDATASFVLKQHRTDVADNLQACAFDRRKEGVTWTNS